MSRFTVMETPLGGLKVIKRQQVGDSRGFLARLFCADELAAAGWIKPIAQINQTYTENRGTVRGLHFQYEPHAEMKLVTCLRGAVHDVAVDVRVGSSTYLQSFAVTLSAENQQALLIPEGFAHGFQTIEAGCELLYCHSESYVAAAEGGLNASDTALGIKWPLPVSEMSARDKAHPVSSAAFRGVRT
jgi:dTDP-4-dehydrorhamnose 3,5-epimerase